MTISLSSWQFLDALLDTAHLSLILFILFGFLHPRLRRIHLLATAATLVSWFGCGLYYGVGYCFLTDWHWQVKRRLGEEDLPYSFVQYALDRWTGVGLAGWTVDVLVALLGILPFLASLYLWQRDRKT